MLPNILKAAGMWLYQSVCDTSSEHIYLQWSWPYASSFTLLQIAVAASCRLSLMLLAGFKLSTAENGGHSVQFRIVQFLVDVSQVNKHFLLEAFQHLQQLAL